MRIEWPDGTIEIVDFVIPSDTEARKLIREGATNGIELLEEVGMTPDEAEAEVKRLRASS
jgi:hypothetical protein